MNRKVRLSTCVLAFAGLPLMACAAADRNGDDLASANTPSAADSNLEPDASERLSHGGPVGQVTLPDASGQPRSWTYEVVDGVAVVEGDMGLGPVEELEQLAKGVVRTDRTWPDRTLVYKLDASLTAGQKTSIASALAEWRNQTGLITRTATATDTIFLTFKKADKGCVTSNVGRKTGVTIAVAERIDDKGCTTGNIIHEIGHALGFEHEQNRANRDLDILYRSERVLPDARDQFTVANESYHATYYTIDFDSIMMYGSYAFAQNADGLACHAGDSDCLPPMVKTSDNSTWNAQRTALSATDIKTFRRLYPKFTNPTVVVGAITAKVVRNIVAKDRFCVDKGYARATSADDWGSGPNPVAGYSSAQGWYILPSTQNYAVYNSITCTF
jgi:hypothetical protein